MVFNHSNRKPKTLFNRVENFGDGSKEDAGEYHLIDYFGICGKTKTIQVIEDEKKRMEKGKDFFHKFNDRSDLKPNLERVENIKLITLKQKKQQFCNTVL